jgi:decaprenyl-phosphate phosphoribosyltransferase
MNDFIKLIRLDNWVKNLFIFLPVFFAGEIMNVNKLITLFIAFLSFSMVASAVYIFNDYIDIEKDKLHPLKRNRPLASGEVKMAVAFSIMGLFLINGLFFAYITNLKFLYLVLGYAALNIAYTLVLKKIPIVDIHIIAIGFVLRILAGGLVADVFLSKWIIILTFLLSLFLALAKRRDDLLIYNKSGEKMRDSIDGYNLLFVDAAMVLMAAIVVLSYIMYTVSEEVYARMHIEYLYLTSFWVIIGVLRYLQLSIVSEKSGSPTLILLKDTFIQVVLIGWLSSFYFLLYF